MTAVEPTAQPPHQPIDQSANGVPGPGPHTTQPPVMSPAGYVGTPTAQFSQQPINQWPNSVPSAGPQSLQPPVMPPAGHIAAPVAPMRPRRGKLIAALAGLALLIAVGIGIYHHVATSTMNVLGTLTLAGSQASPVSGGPACVGGQSNPGLSAGAPITVYNAAGEPIAWSVLQSGTTDASKDCAFPFVVQNVPTGEIFYAIEIASSGRVSFTGVTFQNVRLSIGQLAQH